ncbi:MAG TPA: twin-arginine translocation signal domain-containing protein, partial [Rhizobiales bacterium]|nr:twin-arginine translocation signal domain-containing protein [Hyphomicrobiales bacterium]
MSKNRIRNKLSGSKVSRRRFLQTAAVTTAAIAAPSIWTSARA